MSAPYRSARKRWNNAPYAYCALPPGQSSSPPPTRSIGSNLDADAARPTIWRKSPAFTRPCPVCALSSNVAMPSIAHSGSARFGKSTGFRPNAPLEAADPSERSAQVNDVRVLVREDQPQPVVCVRDRALAVGSGGADLDQVVRARAWPTRLAGRSGSPAQRARARMPARASDRASSRHPRLPARAGAQLPPRPDESGCRTVVSRSCGIEGVGRIARQRAQGRPRTRPVVSVPRSVQDVLRTWRADLRRIPSRQPPGLIRARPMAASRA